MHIAQTAISGLLIIEPKVFDDARGFFFESYSKRTMAERAGIDVEFVQDNHSCSAKNVLRGLHYQVRQPQGKLVRVVAGEVLDVAVDIRRPSPTFGKWVSVVLSAKNKRMFWVPAGFAHGFVVLSTQAELLYKVTDYCASEHERCIAWDDPSLAIDWKIGSAPILSLKDQSGASFHEAEVFEE